MVRSLVPEKMIYIINSLTCQVQKIRLSMIIKKNEFCVKHVDIAKSKYRKSYFEKYKDNLRNQWQMINGLLNINKKGNSMINKLLDNIGNSITSSQKISGNVNDYFVTSL